MSTRIPARTIIWAFDPFETHNLGSKRVIKALEGFGRVEIEPVYALGNDELGIHAPAVEAEMAKKIALMKLRGLKAPRVLTYDGSTVSSAVDAVLKHAKTRGADLIMTGTHGRKGLPRFFIGSFAETLLLRSRIPVVITHPKEPKSTNGKRPIRGIVFPSDLGPSSRRAFLRALALAKACRARLTLVHGVPHPIEPLVQSGSALLGGGWIASSELLGDAEGRARKTLKRWVSEAARAGVKTTSIVQTAPLPVRDVILSAAGKDDLIAMSAESGPLKSALMGSITRQVVRQARCPVWVMRR